MDELEFIFKLFLLVRVSFKQLFAYLKKKGLIS